MICAHVMRDKLKVRQVIDRLRRERRGSSREIFTCANARVESIRRGFLRRLYAREGYRPTSDAASTRHSYDRISNTATSARKRPHIYSSSVCLSRYDCLTIE